LNALNDAATKGPPVGVTRVIDVQGE